ncbi:hypothetical protein ROHU_001010 [Labeo rohita]|uniref:Integrase catalytic domain-containing protein n=1 Tax=Labeo rohita TaxID=84645 RepID=A0A498P3P5_LABRO|nr:hypothetical protein ROHU_001010 [Labeo rohita]
MPLPFKTRPLLPENKQLALVRLKRLKAKFEKDPKFKDDYVKFMEGVFKDGDAERAEHQPKAGNVWFRKYPITIICDVERMFHRFHVSQEDRDYLRFLWWENDDTNSEPKEYRMKVHLFGAASSPGCANYGMKYLACQNEREYPAAASFIKELMPVNELKSLHKLQITRCFAPEHLGTVQRIELHHFSDASSHGYGQCSYIRVLSKDKVHCSFVIGKARVAPTKIVTIPRLELTAAVISSAVSSMLKEELELKIDQERARRPTETQMMADLPAYRLDPSPPFSYCGMDCFGPFLCKQGRKEHKRYGLIFTCFSSRAIHIEILEDLTTDAFINALRCFIAIRGAVREIRSDQGTNFVGAKNELTKALEELDKERLAAYLSQKQCDFTLNVPDASHMGGVWERQIRTIRSVLSWALSQSAGRLDDASLRTFLYEAMSIINSRPLTTDTINDPKGLEPLTPNHLLTMKSSVPLPPPGKFEQEDLYARKRKKSFPAMNGDLDECLMFVQMKTDW